MILSVRTDKPEAEIGLYEGGRKVAYDTWAAHKELSSTLHTRLEVFMQAVGVDWDEITGIVFYEGPGSFTGLRIGASLVNALSYSYSIPVACSSGEQWQTDGCAKLARGESSPALPNYGSAPLTTAPKK